MHGGVIAFFDILGYQSFLENNSDESAERIVSLLASMETTLHEELTEMLSFREEPSQIEKILALIKWLVFSDTILLTANFRKPIHTPCAGTDG